MKLCSKCSENKKETEFYKAKSNIDGLQTHCKKCDNIRKTIFLRKKNNSGVKRILTEDANRLKSIGQKWCSTCRTAFPFDKFVKNKNVKDGLTSTCKLCMIEKSGKISSDDNHRYYLSRVKNNTVLKGKLKKFNMSVEEYQLLWDAQSGRCASCNKTEEENNKRLAVDHNHATGRNRALLCAKCNAGIGFFNDNPDLLEKAKQYIIKQNRIDKELLDGIS